MPRQLKYVQFEVSIHGINLSEDELPDLVDQIKEAVNNIRVHLPSSRIILDDDVTVELAESAGS